MNANTKINISRGMLSTGARAAAIPFVSCALLLGATAARSQVNVYVDSTKGWVGFMNVFELPANGGGYDFGSSWGIGDLDATFGGNILTLTPNTSIDRDVPGDSYWWVGGAGGAPNKNMDASLYVQDSSLAGQTVTFSGQVIANTLVSPYTSVAFIKDFTTGFSLVGSATTPLMGGTPFSITLATQPGDVIQYGFETIGPDARLTNVANLGSVQIAAPNSVQVGIDPAQTWLGFMNWSAVPTDAGGYGGTGNSAWGVGDLDATFSSGVITFTPNTSISRDVPLPNAYWWNADGSGANNMDANFYVQNDSLAGGLITFSGYCWTNTLIAPYNTNATAFVKDFAPDYSSSRGATAPMISGQKFSLTLSTTAGDHIQYGFEMVGPNANTNLIPASALGEVLMDSNPPPAGPAVTSVLPVNPLVTIGASETFTVTATGGSLTYQWQKNGVNLTNGPGIAGATSASLSLSSLTSSAEGNYTVIVANNMGTNSGSSYLTVLNPSHLTIDPHALWSGFENWYYDDNDTAGPFLGQSAEAPSHLPATFSGAQLTLAPNSSDFNPGNELFNYPDGSPAAIIEADFYVQDDALAGQTLTFGGYCQNNTLVAPYTCVAFIEDFVPNYGSYYSATTNVVAGQPFSVTLATTAGDHIEYGFRTEGPVANPATVASMGNVLISVNPPLVTPSVVGGQVHLSFATETGIKYVVQYKTNLTDSTWQTLTTVSGNAGTVDVPDPVGITQRFYRVILQ